MTSQHTHAHGGAHAHDQRRFRPTDAMTALLDLDGEVLHDYWSAALDWVAARRGRRRPPVLDLGAGTGTGALGLAERFPGAEVIAVDVEPGSLARLRDKAAAAASRDGCGRWSSTLTPAGRTSARLTSPGRRCRCTTWPTRAACSATRWPPPAPAA